MILLIDNYDSFSYNLYQLIGSLRPDVQVVRNDALTLEEIGSALDAALCFDAQHSRWKGMRIFAGEQGDDLSHMICMAEGDRQLLSQAVRSTPGCVIVCGASMISDTLLKEARERHVSLLRTEKHIHEACHALILSLPAERLMVRKVH